MKEPFTELNRILDSLKQKELGPALEWAAAHREALDAQVSWTHLVFDFKNSKLHFCQNFLLTSLKSYYYKIYCNLSFLSGTSVII